MHFWASCLNCPCSIYSFDILVKAPRDKIHRLQLNRYKYIDVSRFISQGSLLEKNVFVIMYLRVIKVYLNTWTPSLDLIL